MKRTTITLAKHLQEFVSQTESLPKEFLDDATLNTFVHRCILDDKDGCMYTVVWNCSSDWVSVYKDKHKTDDPPKLYTLDEIKSWEI